MTLSATTASMTPSTTNLLRTSLPLLIPLQQPLHPSPTYAYRTHQQLAFPQRELLHHHKISTLGNGQSPHTSRSLHFALLRLNRVRTLSNLYLTLRHSMSILGNVCSLDTSLLDFALLHINRMWKGLNIHPTSGNSLDQLGHTSLNPTSGFKVLSLCARQVHRKVYLTATKDTCSGTRRYDT